MSGTRAVMVVMTVVMAVSGCGTPRSFWLKSAGPGAAPIDRTCWDTCMSKWNPGTLERTDCVEKCPESEKRPVTCPSDPGVECVGGPGKVLLYVALGAVLAGLLIGITLAAIL